MALTSVVTDRPSGTCMTIFLSADGLAAAQRLGEGELAQRYLAPIRTPEGDHVEELFHGASRRL